MSNWAALRATLGGRADAPHRDGVCTHRGKRPSRDEPAEDSKGGDPSRRKKTKKTKKTTANQLHAVEEERTAGGDPVPSRGDGGAGSEKTHCDDVPSASRERGRILDVTSILAPEQEAAMLRASEVGRGNAGGSPADPVVEAARLEAVSHLCFRFEKAAAGHLGKRWATAFEELLMCHDRSTDPLLPTDAAADAFIRARLRAAETSDDEVDAVARELVARVGQARRATEAAATLAAKSGKLGAHPRLSASQPTVEHDLDAGGTEDEGRGTKGGRVKMSLRNARVEIRAEHYEKLRRLYALTAQTATVESRRQRGAETADFDEAAFERAAFAMLARYTAAQGGMHRTAGGHHTALHGLVFDVLRDRIGVEAEGFASPLNCRWPRYCSAHADTDAPFGSLGSFFAFNPSEGAFEVNPPFEEALVLRAVTHMKKLLEKAEKAGKPLTFAVITPHWPGRRAWEVRKLRRWAGAKASAHEGSPEAHEMERRAYDLTDDA